MKHTWAYTPRVLQQVVHGHKDVATHTLLQNDCSSLSTRRPYLPAMCYYESSSLQMASRLIKKKIKNRELIFPGVLHLFGIADTKTQE